MSKRIGLFFGSFNPIHIGHLIIADSIQQTAALDEIWFVVSPHNPLKSKQELLPEKQRLRMVEYAIYDNPAFRACDAEFYLPQPSYTVQTLSCLSEKHPDYKFELIMGMDNLESLHLWKNFESILANYIIYAYPRPSFAGSTLSTHQNVRITKLPLLEISSTFIRTAIREGKSARYLLPYPVFEYITENRLYI